MFKMALIHIKVGRELILNSLGRNASLEEYQPIKIGPPAREPRGFGLLQYLDPADAEYHMDGFVLCGRELTVVFAEDNGKKPSEMMARESGRHSPLCYSQPPQYAQSYFCSPDYYSSPPPPPPPRQRHYSRFCCYMQALAKIVMQGLKRLGVRELGIGGPFSYQLRIDFLSSMISQRLCRYVDVVAHLMPCWNSCFQFDKELAIGSPQ